MTKPQCQRTARYQKSENSNAFQQTLHWFQNRDLTFPIRFMASLAVSLIIANVMLESKASANSTMAPTTDPDVAAAGTPSTTALGPESLEEFAFSHTEGPWNPKEMNLDAEQTVALVQAFRDIQSLDSSSCSHQEQVEAFAYLVNKFRIRLGASEQTLNPDLSVSAQIWADQMAKDGAISHSKLSANLSPEFRKIWLRLGENVSVTDNLALGMALMELSIGHQVILADPSYDSMGVGYTLGENGRSHYLVYKSAKTISGIKNSDKGLVFGQELLDSVKSIVTDIKSAQAGLSDKFNCYAPVDYTPMPAPRSINLGSR